MLTEDLAENVMNRMLQNPCTAIGVACICAVAYCLKGIGSVSIKNLINTKLKSLADKKANSKNDQDRKEAVSKGIIESGSCNLIVDDNSYSFSKERIKYFFNNLPETPAVISNFIILEDRLLTAAEEMLSVSEERINEKLTYLEERIEDVIKEVRAVNNIISEEVEQVFTNENLYNSEKKKREKEKLEKERRKKEEERKRREDGIKNSGD